MTREDKRAYNYARDRLANDDYPVYSDEYELRLAYKAGIEDAKNHPRWISVEEELPKDKSWIIVSTVQNSMACPAYYYEGEDIEELRSQGITHWMSLPSIEHLKD